MRKANPTAQIQDMPEVAVDLITIVKMVSKLVPRLELMRVVVGEVQKLKQWESIERSFGY